MPFSLKLSKAWSELLICIFIYIIFFSNSDVMESRYKMVKLLIDNLIQGQLIVSPGKRIQTLFTICVKQNLMID